MSAALVFRSLIPQALDGEEESGGLEEPGDQAVTTRVAVGVGSALTGWRRMPSLRCRGRDGGDRLALGRYEESSALPSNLVTNVVAVVIACIGGLVALADLLVVMSGFAGRRFFVLSDGEVFVVMQPRRGWREGLENNVVPLLRSELVVPWP